MLSDGIAEDMALGRLWVSAGLAAFSETILALISAALAASLYVELRTAKEGATAEGLADIFA